MVLNETYRKLIINIISLLFILLFVYAATSKLLDFETFQIQLAQSPLLSAYAGMVSVLVPSIEILIALLLLIPQFRVRVLYGAFTLMVLFTTYIFIILNFSDFIPCSCGGVLEKLSWTQHLIFNVVFILLVIVAIFSNSNYRVKKSLLLLSTLTIGGFGIVVLLFVFSEQKLYNNNAFQRKYIPKAAIYLRDYVLGSNNYYLAGLRSDVIYLGNYQAPLYLKTLNTALDSIADFPVSISDMDLPYRRARIAVEPPYFYVGDGTVPVIFRGSTKNWKATVFSQDEAYFKQFEIADSAHIGIASISPTTQITVVGLLTKSALRDSVSYNNDIIIKQLDGIFDSDGILLWNTQHKKFLYIYYYRNSFEVMKEDMQFQYSGTTIDTISKAIFDLAYHGKKDQYKRGQSVLVNRRTATYGDYLYINSNRLGRFENKTTPNSAAIIDVYNIIENSYKFSFYIGHQPDKKLDSFRIDKDILIAMVDGRLWIYKLRPEHFNSGLNTTHTGQYQE